MEARSDSDTLFSGSLEGLGPEIAGPRRVTARSASR